MYSAAAQSPIEFNAVEIVQIAQIYPGLGMERAPEDTDVKAGVRPTLKAIWNFRATMGSAREQTGDEVILRKCGQQHQELRLEASCLGAAIEGFVPVDGSG